MRCDPPPAPQPELWGGVECTINRVGEVYFDQFVRNGHDARPDDLDRIAALGVVALRYPVLWEHMTMRSEAWAWADERLTRLRRLGVRPILGLIHHGSGPRHTCLTAPDFADGLAGHAEQVARRYPWVEDYTPVNEPLTTGRFSALYGHWYPHARDGRAFARALLNQCRAVVLSMRAIRRVNSSARLVQTEDLGKTYSTPTLLYQADFENERRWLTFDLLCGKVDRRHPLGAFFLYLGVDESELGWFRDNPCPPDVVGLNHYVTSERFLDERLERYPPAAIGGNGRHAYADVEAVRVLDRLMGPGGALREAWERYRLPVAITESHLGCTREEQMRWLAEVWGAAGEARRDGADVRAVTVWSLLGAFDWDSLVTRDAGHYEPGAFDVRGGVTRATALAEVVRDLASGREPTHPVLDTPGWWRGPERILFPHDETSCPTPMEESVKGVRRIRRLLIAGATGTLGRAFAKVCAARGLAHRLLNRQEMDIANPDSVEAALTECEPWAVVNAAGYVRVDDAERDAAACRRENTVGPAVLADACANRGIRLATFSSDLVFDGRQSEPYREADPVAPLCVYGRSKVEAEGEVARRYADALVIRTSAFFGPWDGYNFVTVALRCLASGETFAAADDLTISPTYLPDLVHATLDLLIDGEGGTWHLANAGGVNWAELAREAARRAGLNHRKVEARDARSFGWPAPRPAYCVLGSERGLFLPPWEDALSRYLAACSFATAC